jgi:molybdenum cofactor cytidylyltransferase
MRETRAPPVTAIVPAAGVSRRMGEPKLLLPFGGSTVVEETVAALYAGGAARIAVVTRPDDAALRERLRDLAGVLTAVNPEPERGMLSSILAGLEALGGPGPLAAAGAVLLVCPADLPALSAETVAAVVASLVPGESGLAVPIHRRSERSEARRGHPLAIAPRLLPELATLDPAVGLRQLLTRRSEELTEVPVDDPGCVHDVDTPDDYLRLTGRAIVSNC